VYNCGTEVRELWGDLNTYRGEVKKVAGGEGEGGLRVYWGQENRRVFHHVVVVVGCVSSDK